MKERIAHFQELLTFWGLSRMAHVPGVWQTSMAVFFMAKQAKKIMHPCRKGMGKDSYTKVAENLSSVK
jgi:hypothetical protein